MLSPTATVPGAAPITRAILAAMRSARSIQPASFQLRIRPSPHSRPTTSARRACVARGRAPSELPSRYDHAVRQHEVRAEGGERVRGVQRLEIGAGEPHAGRMATARVQPADARCTFTGKALTRKPSAGSASRLCSFSIWQ